MIFPKTKTSAPRVFVSIQNRSDTLSALFAGAETHSAHKNMFLLEDSVILGCYRLVIW